MVDLVISGTKYSGKATYSSYSCCVSGFCKGKNILSSPGLSFPFLHLFLFPCLI